MLAKQRAEAAVRRLRELYGIAISADYADARMLAMLELGCTTFDIDRDVGRGGNGRSVGPAQT